MRNHATLKLFPSARLSHPTWLLNAGHMEVGVVQWHTMVVVGDPQGAKAPWHEKHLEE